MAISPQQPGWQRWPQQQPQQQQHHHHHHHNSEYVVVDPSMMPYDSQPVTSGPLQRPMLATEFFHVPYRPGSMASMTGPQYSHQMQFNQYSFNTASPVSPFKQQYPDRPVPRIAPLGSSQSRESSYSHDSRSSSIDGSRSPSIKSEATSLASTHNESAGAAAPAKKTPASSSRTIVPIIPISGGVEATFHTPIDNLMREIQAKRKLTGATEETPCASDAKAEPKESKTAQKKPNPPSRQGRRVYKCTIPGCQRVCKQKTHLQIHIRSHTGEKPYHCSFFNCNKQFSQAGNLKTHFRRHTKERPFNCDTCGKRFPQRGNLRSHMETHLRTVSFVCKLDNCNKPFTARGNLKTHQNNFHKQTILEFHNKLQGVDIEKISEEDFEMLQYLEDIHKNSNKGIKGRGRDSKVMPVQEASVTTSSAGLPMHHTHTLPQPSQPQHTIPRSMAHQAAYMGHASVIGPAGPRGPNPYDMYDMKPEAVTSTPPMPPPPAMYDDQHRSLPFGDRMF
ncbi:hypothetical protein GQ53DRAFT_511955 [Thozetella sp. PMI_491]|nr:hypothetical protein GQ53DRAFT_511955 [Thozetella sp. PMI_491]